MLGESMAGMEESVDISETQDLLQESLALSRLQMLIRSGSAKRQAEGWESDEAALYASVAQTAQWLNERVKVLAAKVPLWATPSPPNPAVWLRLRARPPGSIPGKRRKNPCRHNQNLSRELLKLLKMAQNSSQSGGSGSGSGNPSASGQSGGQGGDFQGQLQGMSGKQMAINTATYQLLKAMMEGRQPGAGKDRRTVRATGREESKVRVRPGGDRWGSRSRRRRERGGPGRTGRSKRRGREGTMGGMANRQGELGESLESLAEGLGEGAAPPRKSAAWRRMRAGWRKPCGKAAFAEEVRRRRSGSNPGCWRPPTPCRSAGKARRARRKPARTTGGGPAASKAPDEARLLQLLREARGNSKALQLSEGQRKCLDEYYDNL